MTQANAWPHAPGFRIRSGTTREAGHPGGLYSEDCRMVRCGRWALACDGREILRFAQE